MKIEGRSGIRLDPQAATRKLKTVAEGLSGLRLLRIYWYHGSNSGPTRQHITLAEQPHVKIRLGYVNKAGEQKGVDSLIVTDMITLARNRAMVECVLLSGDEDLRVGVQLAQEYGVRVHLLGIKPARGSQSMSLLQEADLAHEWARFDIEHFLHKVPDEEPEQALDSLEQVAKLVADSIPANEVADIVRYISETGYRPREIDGSLLAKARESMGFDLSYSQRLEIRNLFSTALEERQRELQTRHTS